MAKIAVSWALYIDSFQLLTPPIKKMITVYPYYSYSMEQEEMKTTSFQLVKCCVEIVHFLVLVER
jgi:hypothetical protein